MGKNIEVLAKLPVLTSKTLHPYARSGRGGRGLSEPQGGFARGSIDRYLAGEPPSWLRRPLAKIQPVLAKEGKPNIDVAKLAKKIEGSGVLNEMVAIKSPEHWKKVIKGLGKDVDGILPVSITAYPTEIWNSHPQPLVDRQLPFIFWPLIEYDEPDFWRWSARDFLRALGVDVHIVKNHCQGIALLRALAMKRFLAKSRIVVFGEQNFPWNAHAAGHLVRKSLGTEIIVRPLADLRTLYKKFSDADLE
jgi:hypothetical protein